MGWLLLAGVLLIVGWQAIDLSRNQSVTVEYHTESIRAVLTADHTRMMLPGQCNSIHWRVTGVSGVFINGQAVEAVKDQVFCPVYGAGGNIKQGTFPTILYLPVAGTAGQTLGIPTEVAFLNSTRWLALLVAIGLSIAAGALTPIRGISRIAQWLRTVWSREDETEARRIARWMGWSLSGLNLLLIAGVADTFWQEPLWPGIAWMALAGSLAVAAVIPAVYERLYQTMQNRWMALLPVAWFILYVMVLDSGMRAIPLPLLWSAVQTWFATIFLWLCFFWLTSYLRRAFVLDAERRKAWILLACLSLIVLAAGVSLPFIRWEIGWKTYQNLPNTFPPLVYMTSDQNIDAAWIYVPYTAEFPWVWRRLNFVIHRPAFHLFTSQLARVLNIHESGYASGAVMAGTTSVVWAHWLTNVGILWLCAMLTYELVRAHTGKHRVGLAASVLMVLGAINVWYISIPSTDFGDVFTALVSLWLLHNLLARPAPPISQVIVYGIVFGLMILIKPLMLYLMFGIGLALILRHWRAGLALTVVPGLTFVLYRILIEAYGVPYQPVEIASGWRTLTWLWNEFIFYTPSQMLVSISVWVGKTTSMIVYFFGALLVVGVVVFSVNKAIRWQITLTGWWLALCSAIWVWIFQYTYPSHILGLMPFIYGGVGLGIDSGTEWLKNRYADRPHLARWLPRILWALAIAHQLAQWLLWQNRQILNYSTF
jgi:hypothetical protein